MSSSIAPTGTRVPRFDSLAERLAWARDTAPLTQQQMADVLAISKRTVQNYESAAQAPKPARVLLWANACNVDYGWLLTGTYGSSTAADSTKSSGRYSHGSMARPSRRATDLVLATV